MPSSLFPTRAALGDRSFPDPLSTGTAQKGLGGFSPVEQLSALPGENASAGDDPAGTSFGVCIGLAQPGFR